MPQEKPVNPETEISELRSAIDEIDFRLVGLLIRRFEIAQRIGQIKEDHGIPVFIGSRESEILENVASWSQAGDVPVPAMQGIFETIFAVSRGLQLDLHESDA